MEAQQQPTRADVDKLKADWDMDPDWDLDETEGFEAYQEELYEHMQKRRRELAEAEQRRLRAKAGREGVSVETLQRIEVLESIAESHARSARRVLVHYFDAVGLGSDFENRSELDSLVDAIVESAVARTQAALLKPAKGAKS